MSVGVQRAARNDQQNLAALSILASLNARARGERGDADGFFFDRREPPGRQMVRSTSRPSAIPFYGSLVGADAGARAVGPSDDDDVGVAWSAAAAATYGAIEQRRPNSAAVTWGAWPRSFYDVVGVQRAARNDQQNLAALSILASLNARARGERGDADGFFFDRREPPGRQMVRSTSRPSAIPFYGSLVGADAGARAVGPSDDDDVGFAWSAAAAASLRGHRTTTAKFCSSDMGRLASLVLRCGRGAARGSERSAESGRVIHSRCLNARARGERGDADGFFFDRREPPGRQMVRSTSRPSAIPFYGSLVGADAGARAVGPSDDDDVGFAWSGGGVAARPTGPSNNDGQILQQ